MTISDRLYNIVYVCISTGWSCTERRVIRDCQVSSAKGHKVSIYCHTDSLLDLKARALGINTLYHYGKFTSSIIEISRFFNLRQIIKKGKVDIIHCYDIKVLWFIAFFLRRHNLISFIVTLNKEVGLFHLGIIKRILKRRIDLLFIPLKEMKDDVFHNFSISPVKIEVLGTGIDKINLSKSRNIIPNKIKDTNIIGSIINDNKESLSMLNFFINNILSFKEQNIKKPISLVLFCENNWETNIYYKEFCEKINNYLLKDSIYMVNCEDIPLIQKEISIWADLSSSGNLQDFTITALINLCPIIVTRNVGSLALIKNYGKVGEIYKSYDGHEFRGKCHKLLSDRNSYIKNLKSVQDDIYCDHGLETYKKVLFVNYGKTVIKRKRLYSR